MQHQTSLSDDAAAEAPPPPPPPTEFSTVPPRRRRRLPRATPGIASLTVLAALLGVLLGGRAAAEDGRSAATTALAAGHPAQAVSLDEAVGARGGLLMLLDSGAPAAAQYDAQVARIAWARQLAAAEQPDSAIAVLSVVRQPTLTAQAAQARAQILLGAASAAIRSGHAELALLRLNDAARGNPPSSLLATIASLRAAAEVEAAAELLAGNRAPDAVALLDDAAANGAGAAAKAAYPSTLLAAGQAEIAAFDYQEAATSLQRLVANYGNSAQARSARALLRAPQRVSGTLVDAAGHGVAGRVRLSTHFTQLSGGYFTSGPFYYAGADANGDFSIASVPLGGPYVLEYLRDTGWMTLVDPRTGQPADPVSVGALQPEDLIFIVLPA